MKELYEKVYIKTEADNPKEYGNYLTEFGWMKYYGRWYFSENREATYTRGIDWYFRPIEQEDECPSDEEIKKAAMEYEGVGNRYLEGMRYRNDFTSSAEWARKYKRESK